MRAAELTVLDQIIVRKRAELLVQQASIGIEELEQMARPPRRPFRSALEMKRPAIISEVKKASLDAIRAADFQSTRIASSDACCESYASGGDGKARSQRPKPARSVT